MTIIVPDPLKVLHATLRRNPLAFLDKSFSTVSPGQTLVQDWHLSAIAHRLEQVRKGEVRRLIINLPPRSLKSITASVAFPAFALGHDPTRRLICVSYSSELAAKHANDFRAVITSQWYREIFPRTIIGKKDSEGEIELTQRGSRLSTSVGGTLTGRGGDLIIIDDPLKPIDAQSQTKRSAVNAWYNNTLISRLDDKQTGAIVIVMQRVHIDDLTGFVLDNSAEWTVLNLAAIAQSDEAIPLLGGETHHRKIGDVLSPSREPLHILEGLKRQLGSDYFSAQYQQEPVPPGGAMIKRHWPRRYDGEPPLGRSSMILQSWDTASKGSPDNDYSVCTTWRLIDGTLWYLLDVYRERINYPTLKAKVEALAATWRADQVLVEDAGTAIALVQELQCVIPGITAVKPERDKEVRMSTASIRFEAGQVYLPTRAPWLADLEAELFSFPGSRYDDQINSISQAINHPSTIASWLRFGAAMDE